MDLVESSVKVIDTKGEIERYDYADFDRNQLFIDEVKHFFNCIEGKETPLVDIETARQGMVIGSKILESIEKEVSISLK
jgi:predicted dehydrogenase